MLVRAKFYVPLRLWLLSTCTPDCMEFMSLISMPLVFLAGTFNLSRQKKKKRRKKRRGKNSHEYDEVLWALQIRHFDSPKKPKCFVLHLYPLCYHCAASSSLTLQFHYLAPTRIIFAFPKLLSEPGHYIGCSAVLWSSIPCALSNSVWAVWTLETASFEVCHDQGWEFDFLL